MSCQLKAFAKIDGNRTICAETSGNVRAMYSDSSGSTDTSDTATDLSYLSNCCVALSPGGELLTVAKGNTLCIMTAKWISQDDDEDIKTKFKPTWTGNLCHYPREEITAVQCLPLILPNKPSQRNSPEQIDWTCIAVGFNTGYLRFYDEGGDLLLSEKIHDEPILFIKCQSSLPPKCSLHDDNSEELYVTFSSTLAIIPGNTLFQTLRDCRNQLARVKANVPEHLAPPSLSLKKWAFKDQDILRDCEVIGPSSSTLFDHLLTASIRGGFNTRYRSGPPKSTIVVAAGKGSFIGFHHALEMVGGRSVLTDVAQAVKSRFKGFFGGSASESQKSSAVIEPPENLACRSSLNDFNREGIHIVCSPNREYSAVSDGFGRVTLINNFRGIAVRMWKGYRQAQLGWLYVDEEESSQRGDEKHPLRSVLFLIIFDPKKGILEVWTVPNGVRVAAFPCSKKGRLLYTGHSLVGLSNTGKWVSKSIFSCVFVDPDGIIFQIIVPFHCALSDSTSERAADLALLRKLKNVLKEAEREDEHLAQEVGLLAAELKTKEVRKQMLMVLSSNKYVTVDALEAALAVFMDKAKNEDSGSSEGNDLMLLSSLQIRNLLAFYKFLHQQREKPPNYTSVVPQEGISDFKAVSDVLSVSEREVTALKLLLSLLDLPVSSQNTPKREVRVTFKERASSGSLLVDYLSCFDFGKTVKGFEAQNSVAIKKLVPAKMSMLAELLFQGILYSDIPIEVWQAEAACCGIAPSNLLELAVLFWLNRSPGKGMEVEMIRFSEIIRAICLLEEVHTCNLSSFWSIVRRILVEACQPLNALTGALVCRAVAYSMEKNNLKKRTKSPKKTSSSISKTENSEDPSLLEGKSSSNVVSQSADREDQDTTESRKSSAEWEDVSWDSVKWNLLIGRLEDIALLDQVLNQNPVDLCDLPTKTMLPCVRYEKPSISLSCILQKGKGAISEKVAKWLTACGVDPKLLIEKSDIECPSAMEVDEPGPEDRSEVTVREGTPLALEEGTEASPSSSQESQSQIFDKINLLRRHFPYSLCGSVLVANLSWEYLLEWKKAPEHVEILNAAMTCLQSIPNTHVQQGMCCLIWPSHLKQLFESATYIVNASSGNPKEKICRRELHMSESQLIVFVGSCVKFLQLFLEATSHSEVTPHPDPKAVVNCCEDIWDYDEQNSITSPPSLTRMALLQQPPPFEHLHSLYQVAVCMQMILDLGLRGQLLKPLFSLQNWSMMFGDNPYAVSYNTPLENRRTQFLKRVISGAMQSLLSSDPSHVSDLNGGHSTDISTAMQWFGKCKDLAYTWEVSMDAIRRHQVFLFYSSGHDRLAEEILPAVNELDKLASDLLLICGQRLKIFFSHHPDEVCNIDLYLKIHLEDMNAMGVREVPLSDTMLLSHHIVKYLPEDDPEREFAELMSQALSDLISEESDDPAHSSLM